MSDKFQSPVGNCSSQRLSADDSLEASGLTGGHRSNSTNAEAIGAAWIPRNEYPDPPTPSEHDCEENFALTHMELRGTPLIATVSSLQNSPEIVEEEETPPIPLPPNPLVQR